MDLSISRLGPAKINSPLKLSTKRGDRVCNFVPDDDRILYEVSLRACQACRSDTAFEPLTMEQAGPREHIYFDPSKVRVGIVTCGGLCPGINNVIRSMVMELHYHYEVRHIFGFKYGYAGLVPEAGYDVIDLTPALVKNIHHDGGTILGSSRGHQEEETMVDTLERMGIGILFTIGGDGTGPSSPPQSATPYRGGSKGSPRGRALPPWSFAAAFFTTICRISKFGGCSTFF